MKLIDHYMYLRGDIHRIEKEMEQAVSKAHPVLQEATLQLLQAGGKRIRPVFTLLSAKFGNYDTQALKHIGVALEFVHMASLVHDDVIDNSDLRRGKLTVKAKWDNRVAMYTGDYMFGKAIARVANFEEVGIHETMAWVMHEMAVGEIEQIRLQYEWEQNIRTYLRRIRRKTAVLIAGSCKMGAQVAGVSPQVQKGLYQFGYYVGLAFQITDDILDFTSSEEALGKPAGGDLLQGNITLPVIYAMEKDSALKTELLQTFAESLPSREKMAHLLEQIKESGGVEYARAINNRYLNKAYQTLETLPDIPARRSLFEIANYIGERDH
ncbi:heptaprenyl diphosphate synthase component II [Natribacillus halophilus]|uniref:Heptaprenyl diphosphate synthase n=1 Tax=Natribacillus halophilus TaxID=549003 RepID=A0A1G8JD18_9BACI|nr:heptaprenyl diphosphate synthase component II [Natribacillus halophilus]SDI28867.1 heptaprenyl diphosphate synthase [Natribacillus halophilus]